jgi:hypothetical protein
MCSLRVYIMGCRAKINFYRSLAESGEQTKSISTTKTINGERQTFGLETAVMQYFRL